MGRRRTPGISYFPHDTRPEDDESLAFIEAKHGNDGYAAWFKILEMIYRGEGYFITWTGRTSVLNAARFHIPAEKLDEIVSDMVEEGLFDSELWRQHQVLTSRSIQIRYLEATSKRTDVEIRAELSLLHRTDDSEAKSGEKSNPEQKQAFPERKQGFPERKGAETAVSGVSGTQSKVKESKEEETRYDLENSLDPENIKQPSNFLAPSARRGVSPMKDELANQYQDAFASQHPAEAWNIPRERKHLVDIAARTRRLADVTGRSPPDLAAQIMDQFDRMRRTGRGDFWRGAPFTPSGLTTRWDQVVTALAAQETAEVVF